MLVATACADDPGPGKLFDEDGTWELKSLALSGAGLEDIPGNREGDFLMKFDAENKVVQTAMCSNRENSTPNNSECQGFEDAQWFCQCYGYDFVEDQMAWQMFEAGNMPPVVKVGEEPEASEVGGGTDTDTDGGSGGGTAGGGEPVPAGGVHQLTVIEVLGTAATVDFTPLPAGVFGSDGMASKFIFQKKAASVFDPVLEGEERPTCQPCI